jgi:Cu+-exporting ATPase
MENFTIAPPKTKIYTCYHCGESCQNEIIQFDQKEFCCEGCKLVYDLLRENDLCTYYNLNQNPGQTLKKTNLVSKFEFLDHQQVFNKIIRFKNDSQTHVVFFIPKMHCSSCIWLLENLHRLNPGIISSKVNFVRKEATIVFNHQQVKMSELVALMANIGYEPLINLNDLEKNETNNESRTRVIKIGLAGFCFGNIMMLSFPEYFSSGNFMEQENLQTFFGYLNLFLSLPVFFYSASEFFVSAYKGLKFKYLNIDAPVALAILITFARSVFEIVSQTGAGYLDSMSGIVFFMLIGRYFQNKTYETMSFERDYKSYFPVGVSVLGKDGSETNKPVSTLKKGDHIFIRNSELIPADAILLSPQANIDYSFISGESEPIKKVAGDFLYAGGKQMEGAVRMEIVNPTSQSYLTQLWNQDTSSEQEKIEKTYIDRINKYFTSTVLLISVFSGVIWSFFDSSKALNAFTAVLIVACPCGLLLTNTFASGNVLRLFGRRKLYLKNAAVIEKLSRIDTIIFDKTGTITHGASIRFEGPKLSDNELALAVMLSSQSSHPLSRKISSSFANGKANWSVNDFVEIPSKGLKAQVGNHFVVMGSEYFVTGNQSISKLDSTKVFLMIDGELKGFFSFNNAYRDGLKKLIEQLGHKFNLKVLSGDNDSERKTVESIFGSHAEIRFNQKPEDKMKFVQALRSQGKTVLMVGDGLNDAGALKHSDVGIAISDDTNNFSPACDAILDGANLGKLDYFLRMAKTTKTVTITTFFISSIYNLIGLTFAVQGVLSPVIAAILMPLSSISIVILSTGLSSLMAKVLDKEG